MEYMSCAEAAGKWGISERRVQKLCEGERIPGVSKFGSRTDRRRFYFADTGAD